jgi:hypothetical protein
MKEIILHNHNGKLAVTALTGEVELTDYISTHMSEKKYKVLKSISEIVLDDLFFDAYEFDQEIGAKVNIDKAKEIWLNHYRTARTPLLAALDVDFMRAVESSDTNLQKEIASKKQALRDVTKTDLPNTLEEIKNTWPEILGQNPFNK